VTDDALAYVRELERRDDAIAESLETLGSLRGRTRAIGAEATRLAAVLDRFPRERDAAAHALERAQAEVERTRSELADAEEQLRKSRRDREGREAAVESAQRAVERAEQELASARTRVAAVDEAERSAERESDVVVTAALALAREVAGAPRLGSRTPEAPEPELDGVTDWAARADGALLLARSGLDGEREAVVREANELAASVLGEQPAQTGVRRIREQVEARDVRG
jgi:DNA repair exonuclease SbcCD ATPase subunit